MEKNKVAGVLKILHNYQDHEFPSISLYFVWLLVDSSLSSTEGDSFCQISNIDIELEMARKSNSHFKVYPLILDKKTC